MKPAKILIRFVRTFANLKADVGDIMQVDRAMGLALIGDGRAVEVAEQNPIISGSTAADPDPEPEPEDPITNGPSWESVTDGD